MMEHARPPLATDVGTHYIHFPPIGPGIDIR